MARDSRLTAHFAAEQADIQTHMHVLEQAFNTLERTMTDLLAHLEATGALAGGDPFVARYNEAVRLLRKQGLFKGALPGEEVEDRKITCPGCNAVLRNVEGAPGDRCDWCGYVFPFTCPACGHELENVTGEPGEICLWCHHQLA